MAKINPTLLILAAGLGSRYGSLKQIDKVGPAGEMILDYSVYDAIRSGFKKIVFVISKNIESEFKQLILERFPSKIEVSYVIQVLDVDYFIGENISNRSKPWGTGHALLSASSAISDPFLVINADDFYGAESYQIAFDFLSVRNNSSFDYALIGYELNKTLSENGSVSRGICSVNEKMELSSIIERTEIRRDKERIFYKNEDEEWIELIGNEIVSMNMYALTPSIFDSARRIFHDFLVKYRNNGSAEFYLPSLIDKTITSNIATVHLLKTEAEWFGLTYQQDKPLVEKKILEKIKKGIYPKNLWESIGEV